MLGEHGEVERVEPAGAMSYQEEYQGGEVMLLGHPPYHRPKLPHSTEAHACSRELGARPASATSQICDLKLFSTVLRCLLGEMKSLSILLAQMEIFSAFRKGALPQGAFLLFAGTCNHSVSS